MTYARPGYGQWLAAHIPGATARLIDGEGHLSLVVSRFGDVLDEVLATARARA